MSAGGAGLVSVSTSRTDPVLIDKVAARCTRLRKNVGIGAKVLTNLGVSRSWMVTLTYRSGEAWQPKQVAECIQRLRVWLKRAHGASLRYEWVLETKVRKTGAEKGKVREHYHLILWLPAQVAKSELMLDARGYWPHGLTNVVEAYGPVGYLMKYASKFDSEGSFPKGARCYGMGGLGDVGRSVRRWVNWPAFVQARAAITDGWRPSPGGGWADASTGEWLPAEWGLSFSTPRHTCLVRLHDHGRPVDAWGPFNWIPNPGGVAAPEYLH